MADCWQLKQGTDGHPVLSAPYWDQQVTICKILKTNLNWFNLRKPKSLSGFFGDVQADFVLFHAVLFGIRVSVLSHKCSQSVMPQAQRYQNCLRKSCKGILVIDVQMILSTMHCLTIHPSKGFNQAHLFKIAWYFLRPYMEPNPETYWAFVLGTLARDGSRRPRDDWKKTP